MVKHYTPLGQFSVCFSRVKSKLIVFIKSLLFSALLAVENVGVSRQQQYHVLYLSV
jgi:hypothetical protein